MRQSKLYVLAMRAACSGECLDDLFRRERAHLFCEVERKLVPLSEHDEVQGHAKSDCEQGRNGIR